MTATIGTIRTIPDFSTTPLYAAAVVTTTDDPRLLTLWCHYALWLPIDRAFGQQSDSATWAERTNLTTDQVRSLAQTLDERGLITRNGIPSGSLQQASWDTVTPYTNALRERPDVSLVPDLSTTPLYAAAAVNTTDDPRLLTLWCHYAFWLPIDAALKQYAEQTDWAERTNLPEEQIPPLTDTLAMRGLIAPHGVPFWTIQQISWNVVLPYSNALREQAGLRTMAPQQTRFALG